MLSLGFVTEFPSTKDEATTNSILESQQVFAWKISRKILKNRWGAFRLYAVYYVFEEPVETHAPQGRLEKQGRAAVMLFRGGQGSPRTRLEDEKKTPYGFLSF